MSVFTAIADLRSRFLERYDRNDEREFLPAALEVRDLHEVARGERLLIFLLID